MVRYNKKMFPNLDGTFLYFASKYFICEFQWPIKWFERVGTERFYSHCNSERDISIRDWPLETCTTNTQTSVEFKMKSGISKEARQLNENWSAILWCISHLWIFKSWRLDLRLQNINCGAETQLLRAWANQIIVLKCFMQECALI